MNWGITGSNWSGTSAEEALLSPWAPDSILTAVEARRGALLRVGCLTLSCPLAGRSRSENVPLSRFFGVLGNGGHFPGSPMHRIGLENGRQVQEVGSLRPHGPLPRNQFVNGRHFPRNAIPDMRIMSSEPAKAHGPMKNLRRICLYSMGRRGTITVIRI